MDRARKIAAGLAVRVMLESPFLGKSAGTREHLESACLPGARLIARAEKQVKLNGKRIALQEKRIRGLLLPEGVIMPPFYDDFRNAWDVKTRTDVTVSRALQDIDDTLMEMV